MSTRRARALVVASAVITAVSVALVSGATSRPATATAATASTGPSGPTGPTGTAPGVSTGEPSQVGQSSAVLKGTVDPQDETTSYYFQYGTTTAYGLQSSPADAGSGSGDVGGAFNDCFEGSSCCYGHVTMGHNGIVIGRRDIEIAPNSGGFQNIEISRQGEDMMMGYNRVFHLIPVTVTVTTTTGQTTTQVVTPDPLALALARLTTPAAGRHRGRPAVGVVGRRPPRY